MIAAHNHGQIKLMTKPSKRTRKKKRQMVKLWKQRQKNGDATAWVIETPVEVRDAVAMDIVKSYRSNLAKRKKNPNHVWDYKFRRKKDREQTITIPYKCIKTGGVLYPSFTNKEPLLSFEGVVETEIELQVHLDRTGTSWATPLHNTELLEFDEEKNDLSVCAIDPGIRTFKMVYDNQGIVTEVAPGDVRRIYRLCGHADKLQSKFNHPGVRSKQRCKMCKVWFKIFNRIRNLVKDVHRKGVKFLCEKFHVVFVPDFNTDRMVRKKRSYRRIWSKITRVMMTWSHFSCKTLLKAKAAETGTAIETVTEEYTSKT